MNRWNNKDRLLWTIGSVAVLGALASLFLRYTRVLQFAAMVTKEEIIRNALAATTDRPFACMLSDLEAAFPPELIEGRPVLEFVNNILAARGGPQGMIDGPSVIFSWPPR